MESVTESPKDTSSLAFAFALVALFMAISYVNWVEPRDVAVEKAQEYQQNHFANGQLGIHGRLLIDDEIQYVGIAKNIADGNGYALAAGKPTAVRVPSYPYYLALLFTLYGQSVRVALLGNAFLIPILPLLTFALARSLFGARVAIFATAFCVVDPGIYFLGVGRAYSEPLFAVMLCGATALWARARGLERASSQVSITGAQLRAARLDFSLVSLSALSGLLYGAASLTHTGYLGLPFAILLAEIILRSSKAVIQSAALLVLASALMLCPWAVRNRIVLGETVLSSTNDGGTLLGSVLAAERKRGDWLNPAHVDARFAQLQRMDDSVVRDNALEHAALTELTHISPRTMLVAMCKRLLRLWIPLNRIVDDGVSEKDNLAVNALYLPMMLLALFGLLNCRLTVIVPLLVPCLYATLLGAVTWGGTRFRYGLEPMIACFAGYGLTEAARRLSRKGQREQHLVPRP